MNNLIKAHVTIVGIRPLFQNKFGREAIPLEKKERSGVAGNDPEEWRKTCMVTKEGQLFIEPSYIFGTTIAGAKYIKKGRGSIMNNVRATLQVLDDRILLDRYWPGFPNGKVFDPEVIEPPSEDIEESVYLDVRSVRNPATKARNLRYRIIASSGWKCTFTILWDKTIVSRGEMEACLRDAGQLEGIGNARAIGMGRFMIDSFEIEEI